MSSVDHPAGKAAHIMPAPAPGHQRSRSLDVIRGIAVFGLIWVNAQAMTTTDATADKVSSWLMQVLAAGKFWTLFSILFGVTLAMQLDRATTRGERITLRWLRRMIALFAIGVANAILFFPGDILRAYAIAGVVLLLFNKASQRVVLIAAALFWLYGANVLEPSVIRAKLEGREEAAALGRVPPAELREAGQRMGRAMREGTYLENVKARADWQLKRYATSASRWGGPLNLVETSYLALFLLGLYAGRRRWLQDVKQHEPWLRRFAFGGLLIGLPISILARSPSLAQASLQAQIPWTGATFTGLANLLSMFLLACGYLCALLVLLERPAWQHRFRWLAPAGRMGLTNYVVQLAMLTTLQAGYGFGLQGRIGSLMGTLVACAIFLVQVAYSNYWLSRFQYGPLEWLWRKATYRRPLARRAAMVPGV